MAKYRETNARSYFFKYFEALGTLIYSSNFTPKCLASLRYSGKPLSGEFRPIKIALRCAMGNKIWFGKIIFFMKVTNANIAIGKPFSNFMPNYLL